MLWKTFNAIFLTFLVGFSSLLASFPQSYAQDYTTTIITDPSISRRCGELLDDLKLKRNHGQKIKELLVRNERLQRVTPEEKKKVKGILTDNERRLKREMELTVIKVQRQEENIIRKGCPGLTL
jgi:hypothetical protein